MLSVFVFAAKRMMKGAATLTSFALDFCFTVQHSHSATGKTTFWS